MSTALLNLQAEVEAQLAATRESILAPTAKRITAKLGQILLPDGASAATADVIVLSWRWMNRYYPNTYNPGNIVPPTCWAISNRPDNLEPECANPIHVECASCPKNQFGSATNGGRGKACRNQCLVACVQGDGEGDILTLTLAPTSIQAFSKYVMKLAGSKYIPAQVITQLSLNPSVQYAQYDFKAVDMIQDDKLLQILERQKEANDFLDAYNVSTHLND